MLKYSIGELIIKGSKNIQVLSSLSYMGRFFCLRLSGGGGGRSPQNKTLRKNQEQDRKHRACTRVGGVSPIVSAHPGQGHICLIADTVLLVARLGCHAWRQIDLGGIPGKEQVHTTMSAFARALSLLEWL